MLYVSWPICVFRSSAITSEERIMRPDQCLTSLTTRIAQVIVAFAVATLAGQAQAQSTNRAEKWEFTLQLRYLESEDISGDNGSRATIDSDYGFGFGFAYNFNDHFSLGGDFAWSQPDYKATVTPAAGNGNSTYTVSGTLETFSTHLVALRVRRRRRDLGRHQHTRRPSRERVLVGSLVGILLRPGVPDPPGYVFQL
jgi:hypothetical protein